MFNILLLAVCFGLVLFFYWKKWGKFDLGLILILSYTLVAVLGVFYFRDSIKIYNSIRWEITLWPYVYLFIVLLLFFRPYFTDHQKIYDKLRIKNKKTLSTFSLVFIFSSLVSIFYQFPKVVENLQSGEWLLIRDTLYYDDEFSLYNNQVERLAKIFIQYFRLPAILSFFYFLSSANKKKYIVRVFLGFAIFLPSIFTAIETAARGSLLAFLIDVLIGFFIFKNRIPLKIKKRIYLSGSIVLLIIVSFSIAVTASRFGDLDQSSSVFYYFSHSFMSFNYGVVDTIHSYADGKYFFNFFFENKMINFYSYGTHFGTSFITFVGTLYIDFGPIGTFLIAVVVPFLISLRFKFNKTIDFADLYLYAFYLSYLINGVFVVGLSNSLDWIIAILFILTFKILKF